MGVYCSGVGACNDISITCADTTTYSCNIYCTGPGACIGSVFILPPDWYGNVICGQKDGSNNDRACKGIHVIIPPPNIMYTYGDYSIGCHGENACLDATFEFLAFNTSDPALNGWTRRNTLSCDIEHDGSDVSCVNITTVCPWENDYPQHCFGRIDNPIPTPLPTPSPTGASTIICESDTNHSSQCVGPILCDEIAMYFV